MPEYAFSDTYLNKQTARVSAALAGAGAWDATPIEMTCAGREYMSIYFKYTRGAAGGAFNFKIEASCDGVGTDWYQVSQYSSAVLNPGVDTTSKIQKEDVTFTSSGAAAEYVVYGPVEIGGNVDRIRINAREIGVVATPGTLRAIVMFN